MNKYFIGCLACVLLLPAVGFVQADTSVSSQFQQVFSVPVQDILVPTVVEIVLPDLQNKRNQFLVVDNANKNLIASLYNKTYEIEPVKYNVLESGRVLPSLTDDEYSTNETFPVSADTGGSVAFEITSEMEFTASGLDLDLARNVALPTFVSIEATVAGESQIIVAKTKVSGTRISFPKTVSDSWVVTLQYAQPLRLNELRFVQSDVEATVEHTLRFLAQPNTVYEVYLDPESYVTVPRTESGNLTSDEDVLFIEEFPTLNANAGFVFSDTDGDGIPDQRDNCVRLANPDQVDVNNNDRGDVCDDFDRDGVINSDDNCINQPNRQQYDEDVDGIGDACDDAESRVTEKYGWIPWAAMGTALAVFALLFAIVLRRIEQDRKKEQQQNEIKDPRSDVE